MFRFSISLVCAAAIALAAFSAQAGVFYECDVDARRTNGWVSKKIGFVFDDDGGVTVIDAVILQFTDQPMVARASGGPDKYRITWNISGARDSNGQVVPTFRYVANLNIKTRKLLVSAKPALAPQRWIGRGTCQPRAPGK